MGRFNSMASRFLASAMSRLDGSAADGIHLLWTAPLRIGYSIDGFDIQRRETERREVVCYTLTDQELATLHATFRVRVPPGLIGVRRTTCPEFPQQPPDEPAPQVERLAEELRTDFRKLPKGAGANPRREQTGESGIGDAADGPRPSLRSGMPARTSDWIAGFGFKSIS